MDLRGISAILAAIAWPLVATALAFTFRTPLFSLLSRLSESFTVKSIKLKVLGAEVELTPEQAKGALDELLKEIVDSTNELSPTEIKLFQEIRTADGRRTVSDILPGFVRGNEHHKRLRVLRDRKLIRPFEGGRWEASQHPVITRFGELTLQIKPVGLATPIA